MIWNIDTNLTNHGQVPTSAGRVRAQTSTGKYQWTQKYEWARAGTDEQAKDGQEWMQAGEHRQGRMSVGKYEWARGSMNGHEQVRMSGQLRTMGNDECGQVLTGPRGYRRAGIIPCFFYGRFNHRTLGRSCYLAMCAIFIYFDTWVLSCLNSFFTKL